MSEPEHSELALRRRRIKVRAGHRGIREMDLLLGGFAQTHLDDLSEEDVDAFERLLDVPDHDVLAWISGNAPTPPEFDTPLLDRLKTIRLTPDDYN